MGRYVNIPVWIMNHFVLFKKIWFCFLLTMEHFSSTSSWNFRNLSCTSTSLRKKDRKWVKGCLLLNVSRRTSIRVRAEITPFRCWPVITASKRKKTLRGSRTHKCLTGRRHLILPSLGITKAKKTTSEFDVNRINLKIKYLGVGRSEKGLQHKH